MGQFDYLQCVFLLRYSKNRFQFNCRNKIFWIKKEKTFSQNINVNWNIVKGLYTYIHHLCLYKKKKILSIIIKGKVTRVVGFTAC